jgi:hypothetical protein
MPIKYPLSYYHPAVQSFEISGFNSTDDGGMDTRVFAGLMGSRIQWLSKALISSFA